MIEITYWDYGWGGEITARGHAEGGAYGEDVICAGVSALMQTLCLRLRGRAGCRTEMAPGRARIGFLRRGKAAQDVEFTLCGLRWIAETYPDNVHMKEKRGAG